MSEPYAASQTLARGIGDRPTAESGNLEPISTWAVGDYVAI
jgi:hypothetical protein